MPQAWIMGSATELKSVGLDQFSQYMQEHSGTGNVVSAYKSVAWAYRCVQLRCNALSGVPWSVLRGETEQELVWPMESLLWKTEAALLLFGAAYLLKTKARFVLNGGLQWLNPQTMRVVSNQTKGITGFEQLVGSEKRTYAPEEIVYFHSWNPADDLGAGVSPMQVVLDALGLAANANAWAAKFFEHGGIPAVILTTDQTPPDAEIERVRSVWKQMYEGVRNAFRTAILRYGLKPTIVGSPIKDLAMTELMGGVRQQIAMAFGVPPSMVGDSASNYATARTERLSFWQDTLLPEATLLEATLNEQLFEPLGLRFEFQTGAIEAIQQDEAEKALNVAKLLEAGIITVQEARDQMGFGPAPAELLEKPEQEPVQPAEQAETGPDPEMQGELRKWRAKARKRGVCDFESEHIPEGLAEVIKSAMGSAGVDAAFSFLKTEPEGMDAASGALEINLAERLRRQHAEAQKAILAGTEYNYQGFSEDMRAGIQPALAQAVTEQVLRTAAQVGIDFDVAVVNAKALEWVGNYAYELIHGMTDTTRGVVSKAMELYIGTPGMTNEDLWGLLEPAFGPVRAKMISITEITRAYAMSSIIYQKMLKDYGLDMERVWQTARDDRVCPVCGPLHQQPERVWADDHPNGPPAHVRCRCWTTLRLRRA